MKGKNGTLKSEFRAEGMRLPVRNLNRMGAWEHAIGQAWRPAPEDQSNARGSGHLCAVPSHSDGPATYSDCALDPAFAAAIVARCPESLNLPPDEGNEYCAELSIN